MKLNMFCVYDSKGGVYTPPFTFRSNGEAIRAFVDSANEVGHPFFKHKADFTLFHVGEFDDTTGIAVSLAAHVPLGSALEWQRPPGGAQAPVEAAAAASESSSSAEQNGADPWRGREDLRATAEQAAKGVN